MHWWRKCVTNDSIWEHGDIINVKLIFFIKCSLNMFCLTLATLSGTHHTRVPGKSYPRKILPERELRFSYEFMPKKEGKIFLRIYYLLPSPVKFFKGHDFPVTLARPWICDAFLSGDCCCIHLSLSDSATRLETCLFYIRY